MGFLDQKLSDLSLGDLRHLIRTEVSLQTPPIPTGVKNLSDLDVPLVQPDKATQGQALVFNEATGGWETGALGIISGAVSNAQIESVSGSKITAGILSAQLTLTGRLATALTGQRTEIDGSGVRGYDSTGALEVNIPADGSTATFQGNLVTGNLQVNGGLTIDGTTNVMDKGSQLTLNQGQGDPTTLPVVTNKYDDIPATFTDNNFKLGMAYNALGGPLRNTPTFTYVQAFAGSNNSDVIVERKVSDGSLVRSRTIDVSHSKASGTVGQVAFAGTNMYHLWFTSGSVGRLDVYDQATWTYSSTVNVTGLTLTATSFGFTSDGTTLYYIAQAGGVGIPAIAAITTAGSVSGPNATTGGTSQVGAVVSGCAWDGAKLWIIRQGGTAGLVDLIEQYDATTRAMVANSGFQIDVAQFGGNNANDISHDGTNMWVFMDAAFGMAASCGWLRLSNFTWTPGTDRWHFGYVWNDGTNHSKVSSIKTLNLASGIANRPYMRGRFSVTVPTFPVTITQADWYVLNDASGSTPAATALRLQAPTTYVTSNLGSAFYQILYNSGGATAANTNTFPAGTSDITSAGPSGGTPWLLGGDGTFTIPVLTTANRLALPAAGQAQLNSTVTGLEVHDGTAYQQMFAGVDAEDVYDALNAAGGLTGTSAFPIAYTVDPDSALAEMSFASGDLRGGAFLVKRSCSTSGMGFLVTVASVGALSNYTGATLFSIDPATGNWTFIANTGAATSVAGSTNATGWTKFNWRDGADTVNQTYALVPGTIYIVSLTIGLFATSQPKMAAVVPAATAANLQLNFGLSTYMRSAKASSVISVKRTSGLTVAQLSAAASMPLLTVYS